MIDVFLEGLTPEDCPGLDPARIRQVAEKALALHDLSLETHGLTVVVTSNEHITRLNRQYRQVDTATDVLSFAANEIDPVSGSEYLGDVIISYEKARENLAERLGTGLAADLEDELLLLTAHGVLHLLGYDHADAEEEARMWAQQDAILNRPK